MSRVLIVDDDEQMRKLLRSLLEAQEIEVAEAANGREAIELYTAEAYDLLLLDIIMPEMEGIETIVKLRKIDPDIRFIGLSGGGRMSGEHYLKMLRAFRPQYMFKKPLDTDELLAAVKTVLDS